MKIVFTVVSIAMLCAVAEHFFPWWSIAVVAFLISVFIIQKPGTAFLTGFLGVSIFWLIAAIMYDLPNEHLLSTKMAELMHLPGYAAFLGVTIIIGGLLGGLSGWAGALIKRQRTN